MSFLNLFYFSYWFSQPLIARGYILTIWLGGFLLLILVGLVLKIWRSQTKDQEIKKVLRRFGNVGFGFGFLGLLWLFLRQERVPFLAWRFWLLFWAVLFLWNLIRVILYTLKRVPEIKKEKALKEAKEKYLP